MPGYFDDTVGIHGFQEFQGSLREELVDGELRMFRAFVGPSDNRALFLDRMFGLTVVVEKFDVGDNRFEFCLINCGNPVPYPREDSACAALVAAQADPANYILPKTGSMEPWGYRIQPLDDRQSHQLGTLETTIGVGEGEEFESPVPPQVDCLCVIEIEYRLVRRKWASDIHDPAFRSTITGRSDPHKRDVPGVANASDHNDPYLPSPTHYKYSCEFRTEFRRVASETYEVCSFGSDTPSVAASQPRNNFAVTDTTTTVRINVCEFDVTWKDVPILPWSVIRSTLNTVNDEVWFGFPAHGVALVGAEPDERQDVFGFAVYDVKYKFVARTVPANGEDGAGVSGVGDVTPARSSGRFVYNDMVGVYNRGFWDVTIPSSQQNWWPMTFKGRGNPSGTTTFGPDKLPIPAKNFHLLFELPGACPAPPPPP